MARTMNKHEQDQFKKFVDSKSKNLSSKDAIAFLKNIGFCDDKGDAIFPYNSSENNDESIQNHISITISVEKEGTFWIARCHELGTSTYGNSINDAMELLSDAIETHLNTLKDVNEYDRFLKDNNVTVVKG